MPIRVRFAPSPTGYLHVGGARTALFNWLFARREGGAFLLRIEDTDRDRSSPEMVRAILDGMGFLGLDWDEGLVFQSEGVERHCADALRLLAEGRAFRDFTAPADLARLREEDPSRVVRYPREIADAMTQEEAEARAEAGEPHAIRFRVPDGATGWEDRVHGPTRFQNADIEDLVILRSDGTPTYNLAVASDDREMRITHVIRGDDHISNTPKQILIHEALGSPVPIFAHLPMILGPDGKRLSKRHGATAVGDYAAQGILPEALVNFLALLGWSPGTDEEILDRTALIERFSLDRVLKKSAVFDPAKLEWMNGRHLSLRSTEDLHAPVLEALGPDRGEAEGWLAGDSLRLTRLIDLLKPRSRTIREMAEQARPYVLERIDRDPDAVRKHWEKDPEAVRGHLAALTERLAVAEWEEAELEAELRALADARGVGAGKLIHPLRVAVTGRSVSPGIFEVLVLLGRERSLARLQRAQEWLSGLPSENS